VGAEAAKTRRGPRRLGASKSLNPTTPPRAVKRLRAPEARRHVDGALGEARGFVAVVTGPPE
jgi:hypothetical protein